MTILDKALRIIAPHHCSGCGLVGDILCKACEFYIITDRFERCINCPDGLALGNGICSLCHPYYSRAWVVSARDGELKRVVDSYKFYNLHAAADSLASVLDSRLPDLPDNVQIVPIPTVLSHVRVRGYDHMARIAKKLAARRSLRYSPTLVRNHNLRQLGASAKVREKQAKTAFKAKGVIQKDAVYLIVDDISTTGSTLNYAAKVLRDAGARDVWVASILRQTLD